MGLFRFIKNSISGSHSHLHSNPLAQDDPPPQWTPAPETSHQYGRWNEAPEEEFIAAENFCNEHPLQAPHLLPSDVVDRINVEGCKVWGIEIPISPRFAGRVQSGSGTTIKVHTQKDCQDVCLLSSLPLMAGLYDVEGKDGAYYEISIHRMDGIIAVGTSCRPYPVWRLPGWNRLSAGLHLDDFRKFFEDPDGGRDYCDLLTHISPGDVIGCGYEYSSASLFYTYNGQRLPPAFSGIYVPRQAYDVFAALGVEGYNEFEVNFGSKLFRWKEGNKWSWRVEGHVGRLSGGSSGSLDDELPSY